jgi:hypothetical protein
MTALVSHSHQFLFVHVPKTAGDSLTETLGPYSEGTELRGGRTTLGQLLPICGQWLVGGRGALPKHATARDIARRLTPEQYEAYFKFAFVRNPWDWWISFYHYVRQDPSHHRHQLARTLTFEEFLRRRGTRKKYRQKPFLTDTRGRLIVDFVGRFETLHADFHHICSVLKITGRLGHCNQSRHRDYRGYYTPTTRQLVAEFSAEDIEFFGYDFDGRTTRAAA